MKRPIAITTGIICVMMTIFTGFIFVDNAVADNDSWIGGGGGGSSSSGGEGSNCSESRSNYQYREDCAGVSWIYYKAEEPTTDSIVFGPFTKLGNSGRNMQIEIPGTCSNNGKGGFWHFGVNVQSTWNSIFMDYSS